MLPSSLFNSYGTLQAVTKLHTVNFRVMVPCSLVEEYQALLSGTLPPSSILTMGEVHSSKMLVPNLPDY